MNSQDSSSEDVGMDPFLTELFKNQPTDTEGGEGGNIDQGKTPLREPKRISEEILQQIFLAEPDVVYGTMTLGHQALGPVLRIEVMVPRHALTDALLAVISTNFTHFMQRAQEAGLLPSIGIDIDGLIIPDMDQGEGGD